MASLATIFVAARMFVRLQLNKDHLHWADSWLLVGLFCAVGLVLCDTMADLDGELDNYDNPSVRTLKVCGDVSLSFTEPPDQLFIASSALQPTTSSTRGCTFQNSVSSLSTGRLFP
jgi:hypothetical protein